MPRGLSVRPVRGRPKREAPSSSNTIQADEERPRRLGPGPPADPPFPERRRAGRIRTKLHRVRRSTAKSKTPLEAGPRLPAKGTGHPYLQAGHGLAAKKARRSRGQELEDENRLAGPMREEGRQKTHCSTARGLK